MTDSATPPASAPATPNAYRALGPLDREIVDRYVLEMVANCAGIAQQAPFFANFNDHALDYTARAAHEGIAVSRMKPLTLRAEIIISESREQWSGNPQWLSNLRQRFNLTQLPASDASATRFLNDMIAVDGIQAPSTPTKQASVRRSI